MAWPWPQGQEGAYHRNASHAHRAAPYHPRTAQVFVYFTDHGAPGVLGMPAGPFLYADQLNAAIQGRAKAHGFKEMVMCAWAGWGGGGQVWGCCRARRVRAARGASFFSVTV